MPPRRTVFVLSDVHFAGPAEQARRGFESHGIPNRVVRAAAKFYYERLWLRDPFAHNHLLDAFIEAANGADWVVADGDYSCDTAFVGVSDDAACASAAACLAKLRTAFPGRFAASFGDHELGKKSLFGERGGLRLASWQRACGELALEPLWRVDLGVYVLVGVVSSLIALPVYEPETLVEERAEWRRLRAVHLEAINEIFTGLDPAQRVILFCHDPTALPFLGREAAVSARLSQVECTFIGHLHTRLVWWKSKLLAGMPRITCLGNAVRRLSSALHEAKRWRPFRVRLCPSLAGSELLKDGGYCSLTLDPEGKAPPVVRHHPLRR